MDKKVSSCPMCFGEGALMGKLGKLKWFRCRRCGWVFHAKKRGK